ncbi:MAG: hypothetical protein GXY85_09865 [Candidatus Brocadiaceae bacterium]|nr:hypothetical protein [Candidatus Brocadiaceae bacterium]
MSTDKVDQTNANAGAAALPEARDRIAAPAVCLFSAVAFIYFQAHVDLSLLYHSFWAAAALPAFRLSRTFFLESAMRPGGLLGYASAFLGQVFYADWSAALVVSALAMLLCVATRGFARTASGVRLRMLHLLPGLVFLWPFVRYWNHLAIGLGVLAALTAAWVYASLPWQRWWGRFAAALILTVALFLVAGGFCALFAVLCALHELRARRQVGAGLACLACGFLVPWGLGVRAAGLFWEEAFVHLWPAWPMRNWVSIRAAGVLYALCVLTAAVPAVRPLGRFRLPAAIARGANSRAGLAASAAALALAACLVFGRTLDTSMRDRMRIDVLSQQGRWEDVLREARRLPIGHFNVYVLWDVNRALCFTGALGDRMFTFPQRPDAVLPVTEDFHLDAGALRGANPMAFAKSSRLLLDIGRVNESEQMGAEALEVLGRRPALIRHLFFTNAVKQRVGVALKWLGLLAQDPVHRTWARRWKERMLRDSSLSDVAEVRRLRAAVAKRRPRPGHASLETMLLEQLEADPLDRMALDYLLAHYLAGKRLDRFVEWMPRLSELGISRLPVHYQEAILVYEQEAARAVDLGGLEVGEEARMRLFAFLSASARHGGDLSRARRAAAAYVGTYYYYYYLVFLQKPEPGAG